MRPRPRQIQPWFRELIWGTTALEPWFPNSAEPVGEVWFSSDTLLTKFLFTAQQLSVQVHPTEDYARANENSCGKTEIWLVLHAEQDARIGLGFVGKLDKEQVRAAALDGTVEQLMHWIPVHPGDVLLCEAGSVHALGKGLTLIEIQQKADITYRLFDYGRGRELHLDKALDVARLEPHPAQVAPSPLSDSSSLLAECPFFRVESIRFQETTRWPAAQPHEEVWVCVEGKGLLRDAAMAAGATLELRPGVVIAVPPQSAPFFILPETPLKLARAWTV